MWWPWEFISLTEDEHHTRRLALDSYASLAHYSAFLPVAAFLVFRLSLRILKGLKFGVNDQGSYQQVPRSPLAKALRQSQSGELSQRWRKFTWWMGDDVYFAGQHWGQRDEWLAGLGWTVWLSILCVVGTGKG